MTDSNVMAVEQLLNELYNKIIQADENGLFDAESTKNYFDSIQSKISNGLLALSCSTTHPNVDLLEARKQYASAYHDFNECVKNRGRRWRLTYKYALPSFIYLIASIFAIIWLPPYFADEYYGIPQWVFFLGVLGGVGQAMWFLWQQVSRNSYRKSWMPWTFVSPFLGGIFGLVVYLIYLGFVSATDSTSALGTSGPGPMVVTLLGGFSWNSTVSLIERQYNSIFGSNKK